MFSTPLEFLQVISIGLLAFQGALTEPRICWVMRLIDLAIGNEH